MRFPSVLAIISLLATTAHAFAPARSTSHASSLQAMPYGDDKMPFYALGVNLAVQVGGQANIKTLLEDDELEIVLKAFGETLTGTSTAATTVVAEYGEV